MVSKGWVAGQGETSHQLMQALNFMVKFCLVCLHNVFTGKLLNFSSG